MTPHDKALAALEAHRKQVATMPRDEFVARAVELNQALYPENAEPGQSRLDVGFARDNWACFWDSYQADAARYGAELAMAWRK